MHDINEKQEFKQYQLNKEETLDYLKNNQNYKCELVNDLNLDDYSFQNGPFTDLCKGPHINYTKELNHLNCYEYPVPIGKGLKKTNVSCIYGTAFFNRKELSIYLNRLEEVKKRDHRLLGKQLDLFSIQKILVVG